VLSCGLCLEVGREAVRTVVVLLSSCLESQTTKEPACSKWVMGFWHTKLSAESPVVALVQADERSQLLFVVC
jgi:hypothetical protein